MSATPRATLDDLMRVEGKAELVGGRIVRYPLMGHAPSQIAGTIACSLLDHADSVGRGEAFAGGLGYAIPELPSGREAFCPDASYYDGPPPVNPMDFIPNPPTLAVEVRREGDYGPAAERAMAAKRADYFEAGTLVVWDVDPEAKIITVYRSTAPATPAVYSKGSFAEAEPAVPGWSVEVDRVFSV